MPAADRDVVDTPPESYSPAEEEALKNMDAVLLALGSRHSDAVYKQLTESKGKYEVVFAAVGLHYMTACTTSDHIGDIEAAANRVYPTGTESPWKITNEKYRSGEGNPCPCFEFSETHKHYLLKC